MAPFAPLFLAPAEIEHEILNSSSETAAKEDDDVEMKEEREKVAGREFLDLLHRAMPPGGRGFGRGRGSGEHITLEDDPMGLTENPLATLASRIEHITPENDHMGLTENFSATYLSSGNACLDFFFQVVPGMEEDYLVSLLESAWKEDALTALKLVFHLRGVRGTGKSDKEMFYWTALWLHKYHPATLAHNIVEVAEFGYFKDTLELLLRLVEGPEQTKTKVEAKSRHKEVRSRGKRNGKAWEHMKEERKRLAVEHAADAVEPDYDDPVFFRPQISGYYIRKGAAAREAAKEGTLKSREERIADSVAKDRADSQRAALARKEKKLDLARKVAQMYHKDSNFQTLYMKVADVFANRLKEDLKSLHENRPFDISLAAKWAPSLDSSYDLRTLLCYAIATRIFPKEAHPEYEGLNDQKYGFEVRERLRKEVLVPLRKALDIPEIYMSAQRWGDVKYNHVPSVAMTNYKALFRKHDEERFTEYLESVKKGEAKIAAGALLPHDILREARNATEKSAEDVAELQWKRMVADLKEHGTFTNCVPVCDVSGSMAGEPMDVCVALGILLSDLSEEPWKGHVITFSEEPQIHFITGESLTEKSNFTTSMDWGMNTNLQLVFDRILEMAQGNKLAPEKMIRRLFIFSDMEFDVASRTPWETDYQVICKKFTSAGYGTPPEIVFWNLRSSRSIPVVNSQKGVALVSGFSKNILKIFLQDDGAIDPIKAMHQAIEGEEYLKLEVVD